ncbi:hypothetical protein ES703_123770 [subsurface metagenome]
MKSIRTGFFVFIASISAPSTSLFFSILRPIAEYASASLTKSGTKGGQFSPGPLQIFGHLSTRFRQVAEYRLLKKNSCHCLTIPRYPLLRIAILMGSSCWLIVAISWIFICMLPSPAISITVASGCAICAPIAAGRPYPMVPRPPDVINCRGLVNL